MPSIPAEDLLTRDQVVSLLDLWGHPYAASWLDRKIADGTLVFAGEPAVVSGTDLWRRLIEDETDKLYNQAWSAYESIKEAESADEATMLGMDDLPSAVEQAFSLAPDLADQHLALLRQHSEARFLDFLRLLGVGTARETTERIDCLAFWEDNAQTASDLRRTLFRLVREDLVATVRTRAH